MESGNKRIDLKESLLGLGFTKPLFIKKLLDVVTDTESFQDLQNYIILTENDKLDSMMLVHNFVKHMKDKLSYENYMQFEKDYHANLPDIAGSINVFSKLFASKINAVELNKVVAIITDNKMSLPDFYSLSVRYRKSYSASEIVILIEDSCL